jgi:plastocyanin
MIVPNNYLRVFVSSWLSSCLVIAAAGGQQAARGTIKGSVVIKGKVPGNAIIRMGVDPKCAQLNEGARVLQEAVAATADGHLANVFVRLKGTFPDSPVPSTPVVIDQRKCVYGPRVIGMRVGQTLQFRNDDQLLHNVHSSSAVGNSFNVGQPIAGMVYSFTPKSEEVMVKIGCDVHRWMTAYVGVVTNPYFAVSGADGSFEIPNVPAGKYTLEAWHEQLGVLTSAVVVKAGATAPVGLTYEINN